MRDLILTPPGVFIIIFLLCTALIYVVTPLSAIGEDSRRKLESYACGQRNVVHNVSPDYSQFFPFAFFFTIMHVLILVVATAPVDALTMPLIYAAAGVLALLIIFRR